MFDEEDDYDRFDEDLELADMADDGGERYHAMWLTRYGVERVCMYCETTFLGMPDHGVCPRCADKIEAGWDMGG